MLLRSGMLPQAYVYPAGMRATRDLLRRRLHLVRKRGQLLAHIQMTNQQYNLPAFAKRIAYPSNREGVADHFEDRVVRKSVAVDLALLDRYDTLLTDLESYLVRQAKQHDPQAFQLLRSIPGVGKVLALTILYEIHDVHRFDRVQQFASYARLVKCAKESAGQEARHERREDGQRPPEVGVLGSRGALRPPQRARQEAARDGSRSASARARRSASSRTSSGVRPTTCCYAARRSRSTASSRRSTEGARDA